MCTFSMSGSFTLFSSPQLSFFWGGGEVEMNSFIALPGKGGHRGLMLSKLCVPSPQLIYDAHQAWR